MSATGSLYVAPGSRMRRFAEAVAWLWRLGPVSDVPSSGAVAIGWHEEAGELERSREAGEIAGAVIFANRPGPEEAVVPSRARRVGVAEFESGIRVSGQFVCLHGGNPAVSSSQGVHATRDGSTMVFGADPEASWGALDGFWVWPALASFLSEVLERPLQKLPPIGLVRYDDVPGTAYHQKIGKAKSDARARRRAERAIDAFAATGSTLNVAFSSRAFSSEREVPLDQVWPGAMAAYAGGTADGVIEPICHGYLHLDAAALERGEIEPREFAHDDAAEAARKVDATMEWIEATLGFRPDTFIAPTWAYGDGIRAAVAARALAPWLPPEPGPLLAEGGIRETLFSTLEGLHRLDYGPLQALAEAGVPPTVVLHGGLLDQRMHRLREDRDLGSAARLSVRRDLYRLPALEGIEWVGATEMLRRFREHEGAEVRQG